MIDAARVRGLALAVGFAVSLPLTAADIDTVVPPTDAPAQETMSEAEKVLWLTDQLHMVKEPVGLTYRFEKSGTFEEGFNDVIDLDIFAVKPDGMKSARVNFFTGERHNFVPDNESTNVNPVLGLYLQGDVYEMERLTEGHWRYFHRRIKFAFAEGAQIENVEVEFNGRKASARRVHIRPYAKDPRRDEMKAFADKEYWITVSDEIPGYLYEVYTRVPGTPVEGQPAPAPLLEERLRLVETRPVAPAPAGT